MEHILKDGFTALGLPLSDAALGRFRTYYEYLSEQNKVMNLTAIEGEADTARLHFLDCAALLTVQELKGLSVIDVGSGAGFPGLPLKIAQEDMRLTLLDSLEKRVRFLSETCALLGFEDVACIHARAEDAKELHGQFDAAVSRAVARLNLLAELCLPFVKVGGVFLAMKGPGAAEELAQAAHAIEVLGGGEAEILPYTVPGTEQAHNVVRIRKVKETPAKYPRRWAKIQKQPL
ncbi:MAG: 16S rRNA (guanine(527)-N(7))-methyltransferase RsmG [Oscillospiraceae bacterium]|nr:16S rRNA (guanine(527)-N(7))-methyltransferase RsmG [Oscillospiraceae bacterium]